MLVTQEQQQKLIDICINYDEQEALKEVLENTTVSPTIKDTIGLTFENGLYFHVMPDGSSHT